MVDGIFHDAHEVNEVTTGGEKWVATFATKELAEWFVRTAGTLLPGTSFKVIPV